MEQKWIYPLASKVIAEKINQLAKETGLSKEECTIFYNRNIRTKEEIVKFLDVSPASLHSPKLLKDCEKVASIVLKHIKAGHKIVMYSDFDCDGEKSVAIGVPLLKNLGADISYYINQRPEGFGMLVQGVDNVVAKYPDVKLIISADNGSVAFDAINHAVKDLGIEVCVTDHHEPSADGSLPECSGVVNPKRHDDTYPFKGICGATVFYKLCREIYEQAGKPVSIVDSYLDMVAVATVGDVMPIIDENRYIVQEGLRRINGKSRIVWDAILNTWFDPRFTNALCAKDIAWTISPTINASSRLLGNMDIPLSMFLLENNNSNRAKIFDIAKQMNGINTERKILAADQTKGCMVLAEKQKDESILILCHEELHEGLVGLIAGKIKEKYNRPVIVMTNSKEKPDVWKGSARSVEGFNIKEVMDEIQEEEHCFEAYGGHELAGGLTVKDENMANFKIAMLMKADEYIVEEPVNEVLIDFAMEEEELDSSLYDKIQSLEPFGQGFGKPLVCIKNWDPVSFSQGGKNGQHLYVTGKTGFSYNLWN